MKLILATFITLLASVNFVSFWRGFLEPEAQMGLTVTLTVLGIAAVFAELMTKTKNEESLLRSQLEDRTQQIETLSSRIGDNEAKLMRAESDVENLKLKLESTQLESAKELSRTDELNKGLKNSLLEAEVKIKDLKKSIDNNPDKDEVLLDFVELLQSNGRFIDFVMGDISSIDNETVGAASRVVHQGLSGFIGEFMKIEHIRSEVEGQTINVEAGEESFLYNFIGGDDLELPQSGRLIHRGWKVSQMMLPKKTKNRSKADTVVQRAEVEL